MPVQLHNTLTRATEQFHSQVDNIVKLYTCGPTVYNYLTIGNWVAYISWDTLVRILQANHYDVQRVMNITDVGHLVSDEDTGEDKLEKGARREGKTAWEVAEFYGHDFLNGFDRLNLLKPEYITKATDYITEQLALVRKLKEKGFTYQIDDGIYFDTAKFPTYADFAKLDLDAQKAGARVEFNDEKRNLSDFALWKFTPTGETRDMQWPTPKDLTDEGEERPGFPGWHLECSAMAMSIHGNTLDIHTGGIDHIPVHHTNEIAQSEAASSAVFSNYWLHNNHLRVDNTKISKSLGNGYTLDDLVERGYSELDFRLFVLQSHYRSESNFTWENLDGAKSRLKHWRNIAALRHQTHDTLRSDDQKNDDNSVSLLASSQALIEALNNDLDTPAGLRIIDEAFSRIESVSIERVHQYGLVQFLETIDQLLGLRLLETTPDIDDATKQLIAARYQTRENKDWAESDRMRDEILARGISLSDTPSRTIWQYS